MFLSWSFSIFSVVFLLPNPSYAVAVATVDIPAYFRGHPADRVLPAYGAIITAAPVLDEKLLEKRGLATCGYISGNPSLPITCPAGFTCTSTFEYNQAWACCDQLQCVGNYKTCADYGAPLCGVGLDPGSCSSIYTSILSCSSANPSCFVYARYSSVGAPSTDFSWGCGGSAATILVLDGTTDNGQPPLTISTTAFAGGTVGTFPTATAVGSLPSSSTASTPSSSSTSGGNPLTTTEIIIIGVIGGIVVLVILGYLIYRCCICANARHQTVHHPVNQFGGSEYGQHVPYQATYGAPTAYTSAQTVVGHGGARSAHGGARSVHGGGAPTIIGHGGAPSVIGRGPTPAGIAGWSAGVRPGPPPPPSEMASNYGDHASRY